MEVFEDEQQVEEAVVADDRLFEVDEVLPYLGEAQHFFELEALGLFGLFLEVLVLFLRAALDKDGLLSLRCRVLLDGEEEVRGLLLDVTVDASPQVSSAISDLEFLSEVGVPVCRSRRSCCTPS